MITEWLKCVIYISQKIIEFVIDLLKIFTTNSSSGRILGTQSAGGFQYGLL